MGTGNKMELRLLYRNVGFIASILLLLLIAGGCKVKSSGRDIGTTSIRLWAKDAKLKGDLRLHDADIDSATIHGWHKVEDKIEWTQKLSKGNYVVSLHYAEPYLGGVISVCVGERQFSALIEPTVSWEQYKTSDLGIIHISSSGANTIILQGLQLSLKGDANEEALPDIRWISLTPTAQKAIDGPMGISKEFKGTSLFDGKSLKGWTGNNGKSSLAWFRVEDGSIIGGTMETSIPRNEFIRTECEYGDFELRLKFKMKYPSGKGWNAGIQFRSQPNTELPNEMIGYQADIIAKRWGGLYDEQRRRKFLGTLLTPERAQNERNWNEYVIRCEGPRIRIWLNGHLTQDYIEPYAKTPHPQYGIIPLKGYIALQVHESKNPFEVWYKDIEIQEL